MWTNEDLNRATARAVADSIPVLQRLAADADAVIWSLRTPFAFPDGGPSDDEPSDGRRAAENLWQEGDRIAGRVADDLAQLIRAQRDSIARFNIVFFGRTGAGKSTL